MSRKSVSRYLYDHPEKYNQLIRIVATFEDLGNKIEISASIGRAIYKDLFGRIPTSEQIRQLKDFILENSPEINKHLS